MLKTSRPHNGITTVHLEQIEHDNSRTGKILNYVILSELQELKK